MRIGRQRTHSLNPLRAGFGVLLGVLHFSCAPSLPEAYVGTDFLESELNAPMPHPPLTRNEVLALAQEAGFVDAMMFLSHAIPHLRYGTLNNITQLPLYPPDMPLLLRQGTATKLAAAEQELLNKGYRLLLWDLYRPPETALALWEFAGQKNFVADPNKGWSTHCCGIAVDLTLTDMSGKPVAMPTDFDDFRPEASADYNGQSPEVRAHLTALQEAMKNAGFTTYANEWWHFEDRDIFPLRAEHVLYAHEIGLDIPNVESLKRLR